MADIKEMSRAVFEAFNRGDVKTIIDNCATNCEMICPGPSSVPYAGTMRGREEIMKFFATVGHTQTSPSFRIDKYVAQDETVVAIGQYRSDVPATGKSIDVPLVVALTWQNGKITRHLVLTDNAAVGDAYTAASAQTT